MKPTAVLANLSIGSVGSMVGSMVGFTGNVGGGSLGGSSPLGTAAEP